jgi:hypothetical protein
MTLSLKIDRALTVLSMYNQKNNTYNFLSLKEVLCVNRG